MGSPHEGLGHHKAPYESGRSGLQGFGVYSALGPGVRKKLFRLWGERRLSFWVIVLLQLGAGTKLLRCWGEDLGAKL